MAFPKTDGFFKYLVFFGILSWATWIALVIFVAKADQSNKLEIEQHKNRLLEIDLAWYKEKNQEYANEIAELMFEAQVLTKKLEATQSKK